jgi:hypothetical protein
VRNERISDEIFDLSPYSFSPQPLDEFRGDGGPNRPERVTYCGVCFPEVTLAGNFFRRPYKTTATQQADNVTAFAQDDVPTGTIQYNSTAICSGCPVRRPKKHALAVERFLEFRDDGFELVE